MSNGSIASVLQRMNNGVRAPAPAPARVESAASRFARYKEEMRLGDHSILFGRPKEAPAHYARANQIQAGKA